MYDAPRLIASAMAANNGRVYIYTLGSIEIRLRLCLMLSGLVGEIQGVRPANVHARLKWMLKAVASRMELIIRIATM